MRGEMTGEGGDDGAVAPLPGPIMGIFPYCTGHRVSRRFLSILQKLKCTLALNCLTNMRGRVEHA